MEWKAVSSYFKKDGVSKLVDHQIESFEDFINNKIPLIVCSTTPIVVWHEQDESTKKYKYELRLSFENITYMKPRIQEANGRIKPMFPQDARTRNFTYAAQMFSDIRFVARTYKSPLFKEFDEEVKIFEGVSIGKIPVMLGSSLCIMKDFPLTKEELGECPYDPFGYFLIHGSERTILSQEKVADNQIMVFHTKKMTKYAFSAEMKSLHESFTTPPKKLEVRIMSKFNGFGNPLTMCIPRFTEDIPIVVIFRALGVETDLEISKLIWGDENHPYVEKLAASFKECADIKVYSQEDAITYLTHKFQYGTTLEDKSAYARSLLDTEFLPHVRFGGEAVNQKTFEARKIILLSAVIRRLVLTETGSLSIDDRDSYPNKRVVSTGALLTHLFRQLFQKVSKDIRSKFVHEVNNDNWKKKDVPRPLDILNVNNLYKILKVSTIEGKFKQALATGNFAVQGLGTISSASNATKVGVSQVLNRLSYSATLSHLRRIQTPVEKSGKLLAPRKLHGTSWGFMCPVETPEGHSVGIVKSLSMLSAVTQHIPSITVLSLLREISGIDWITGHRYFTDTALVVNGVIIGFTKIPEKIYTQLKAAKYSFRLHPYTGITWNVHSSCINIDTDGGRAVRPVFRVVDGKIPEMEPSDDWNDWIKTCIEYIDPAESEFTMIAMFPSEIMPKHTHCEIHPTLILGHMASSIPFSDHNQSPRNTYQSAMGKQAMGIYARNYAKRLDKNGYILCTPMRPLVETRMMNILNTHQMPSGDNVIVAIGIYSGYNQEDSVILNRASIDRGLFRSLYYTIYKDEEHRNISSGKEEKFVKPRRENTRGFKNNAYNSISASGAPIMNAYIRENDAVIGKVSSLKHDSSGHAFRDSSTVHRNSEVCRVDGVWNDKNSDGYPFIKVRVVSERVPEIGDKVSSRHGQKGTCGIIMNEEDMPYTANGLRPDIIMNPHAIPSRMTIAQLMETIMGKVCVMKGTFGDGTPYSHLSMKTLNQQMTELGMHPQGNEIMYNGQTGEMMDAEIFMGPAFYQRLKHMVIDKKHYRSRGPIVSLTRQPCEGRSRDGGLRVGEMERDCMISHGVSMFTKERLMDVSDPFTTGMCKGCGTIAVVNPKENIYSCGNCGIETEFELKTIPYAVKLWAQELEAMHIVPRMVFE
jgi:DNA-directed RNA polymerase II subunit RPB2